METLENYNLPVYGGTLFDWAIALGIAAAIVLGVRLLRGLILRRLGTRAMRSQTRIDDAFIELVKATRMLVVAVVALYIGAQWLELPEKAGKALGGLFTIAAFVQVGLWGTTLLKFWLNRSRTTTLAENASAATSLALLGFGGQLVLWSLVTLLALDNLGINVTALIAGLGIGGIAVALAAQNILGDLFASLSIVLDKPFVIGDFIIVDDYMGTVEHVGIKTTRVRSLGGELLIFSNNDLLKARVRNYKRMFERRVVFSFGVLYETPTEALARIPGQVRQIIESQKKVRFDRAHFQKFGESSLDFEVVYWVQDPDYNLYMDIQQAINLALLRQLREDQIGIAFPTRTLYVEAPVHVEVSGDGLARRQENREQRPAQGHS